MAEQLQVEARSVVATPAKPIAPSVLDSSMRVDAAAAYLPTLRSASRQQKYSAASMSLLYRPIPSATDHDRAAGLRGLALTAAASPWSASKGG